jgi:hypothetical protein
MSRSSVESFFRTLILGDFEENQNFAGQMVGGLVSMIPVLDQVMDVRDIAGALFRTNQQGGFPHATTDQIVNLGFAAFGVIPEVGSAFKTVFKPLYKERRAARGAVNGGLQAVERLLGMRKGGAITWVRTKVLGKWVPHTNAAIQKTNAALDTCILFLDTIANLRGWKDYLVPDSIQRLAKEMLPSLRQMKTGIAAALRRASNELREFLEDLLGEKAAAVVMAVGGRAASASANPGTRGRTGRNAAAARPTGRAPVRQPDKKVANRQAQNASRGAGASHPVVQRTRKAFSDLAQKEMGIVGEHLADYYCQNTKGWGIKARHDTGAVNSAKLNDAGQMVQLFPVKVRGRGIDAVWKSNGPKKFAIIEAKASIDPTKSLAAMLGDAKDKSGADSGGSGTLKRGGRGKKDGGADNERQLNSKVTQMSHGWIQTRIKTIRLTDDAVAGDITNRGRAAYSRQVLFFSIPQIHSHAEALVKLVAREAVPSTFHSSHEITRAWGDAEIEKVVDNRAGFRGQGRDARDRKKTK